MVKAPDSKIRALKNTVREEDEMILLLRQRNAESGALERDLQIERRERAKFAGKQPSGRPNRTSAINRISLYGICCFG